MSEYENQEQACLELQKKAQAYDELCDLFSIGSEARKKPSVLISNIKNTKEHSEKLLAVERTYFSSNDSDTTDEDYDNSQTKPSAWGDSTEEYVENIGLVIKERYSHSIEDSDKIKVTPAQMSVISMLVCSLIAKNLREKTPKNTEAIKNLSERFNRLFDVIGN